MLEKLSKKFTNNYNEVPLFQVTFNLNKYKDSGDVYSKELSKDQINSIVSFLS